MVDVRIVLKPETEPSLKSDIEYTVEKAFRKHGIEMCKVNDEMIFACKNPTKEQQYCSLVIAGLLMEDWFVDNTLSAYYNVDDEHIDLLTKVESTRKMLG